MSHRSPHGPRCIVPHKIQVLNVSYVDLFILPSLINLSVTLKGLARTKFDMFHKADTWGGGAVDGDQTSANRLQQPTFHPAVTVNVGKNARTL